MCPKPRRGSRHPIPDQSRFPCPFPGVSGVRGNVFEPFSGSRERFCSLIGSEGPKTFPFRGPHAPFSGLQGPLCWVSPGSPLRGQVRGEQGAHHPNRQPDVARPERPGADPLHLADSDQRKILARERTTEAIQCFLMGGAASSLEAHSYLDLNPRSR